MNKKKIAMAIAILLVIVLIGTVCYGVIMKAITKVEHPIATITFEGYEEPIVVELYPEYAQNTVRNFITLAENGFYDGLKIHRVEEYVIQGGDPNGDGTGSPTLSAIDDEIEKDSEEDKEYTIVGEFKANGYDNNTLAHDRGVISMARGDYRELSSDLTEEGYNSAGCQFFICTKYMQSFNGNYAAFGKMIDGWNTLDAISNVALKVETDEETNETTTTNVPAEDVIIESITIETNDVDYEKPETLEPFDYYTWYLTNMYKNQLTTN